MDTIRYGYSMKIMKKWPGTIVVRTRVFMDMVFDICRSVLDMGFTKLALLDCHGHHSGLLNAVSRELCDACDKPVAILSPATLSRDEFNAIRRSPQGGAIHAGEWETSLILHIAPEVVDLARHQRGYDALPPEFIAGDNFLGRQRVTWSTCPATERDRQLWRPHRRHGGDGRAHPGGSRRQRRALPEGVLVHPVGDHRARRARSRQSAVYSR